MDNILIIGKQILIMFIYMGIGYLMFRKKLISKEGSKSMAHLLLYCILPCVIVKSFCIERTAEKTEALLVSMGLAAVLLLVSMAISFFLYRKSPIDNFGSAFSNAGFMGFPLITAILGSEAVFYAAGFVALLNALQWTYGQWVLSKDRGQMSFKAVVTNPIILSLVIGLLIFFLQIPMPEMITATMGSLAALNGPLAMVVLGVYLAQADLVKMFTSLRLYGVSLVRLVLIPLISFGILLLLPKQYESISMALMIVAAAPIGSNVAVYAQKQNMDYSYAVQTVCISTLLSIIFMPLLIGVAQSIL